MREPCPRHLSHLAWLPLALGCHLASGIDDIKIDRRVADVPTESRFCTPFKDELDSIDPDQWSVDDAASGIDVAYDEMLDGVAVNLTDALSGTRGGLITIGQHDFNDCFVVVEVDPISDPNGYAMVALLESPEDELPLVALRKQGSELITSRADDDLQRIDFNEDQRFWRLRQSGEQIIFEHSQTGDGAWMAVGAVAKPDQARAVHIALLAGSSAPVAADTTTFLFYGLREEAR